MPAPIDQFVELPDRHATGRKLRLHYRDWRGSGSPLLLLHGLASNARIWDLTAPHLTSRFGVIALDQRGHGLSDKPDNGYGFENVTADLAGFIETLGLTRPLIVGHSWGGNVALQFAAQQPQSVAGLVLVDGGFLELSAFPGMTWERAWQMMAPPPLDGMKLDAFLRAARNWPELGALWSDQIREIVLANFQIRDDGSIRPHLSRDNHKKILRAMWEQKPSQLWGRLSCPCLLLPTIRDSPDPRNVMWTEAKGRAIEAAVEKSASVKVTWMESTIHDVPLQRPQELAKMIAEFAARLP